MVLAVESYRQKVAGRARRVSPDAATSVCSDCFERGIAEPAECLVIAGVREPLRSHEAARELLTLREQSSDCLVAARWGVGCE
jgi:hypothetical protein